MKAVPEIIQKDEMVEVVDAANLVGVAGEVVDVRRSLAWALRRLARMQSTGFDSARLAEAMRALKTEVPPEMQLAQVCSAMGLPSPQRLAMPDPVQLPLIAYLPEHGFVVLIEMRAGDIWIATSPKGSVSVGGSELGGRAAIVSMRAVDVRFGASALLGDTGSETGFIGHVYRGLQFYRFDILEACLATGFIGLLALVTSLFSMQVYDRVIPTRAHDTLAILGSGVLLTIIFELAMKMARSKVMDHVVVGLDQRLSREIFSRLLALRVDQLPASVGSLAGQIRGYEQVRGFYTASTLFTLVDLPLAILFVFVIIVLGHPAVAAVPLVCGLVALFLGLTIRRRIMRVALEGASLSNLKTGLLVETVEGIETIKAGAGGWAFLARWVHVTGQTVVNDLKYRSATDGVGYLSASIQQISYAALIAAGAIVVMQGGMTQGALVACSILSGRILAPVMAIPGLLVQHAQARAALEGIERLYRLKLDNHEVESPLTPEVINGHFVLSELKFAYTDNPPALVVPSLEIRAGERVAVLGPIGAGKSTLLRLLSGMYLPNEGKVLLDGLDLSQIHRQTVCEHVGYLQQDHRLFQGTIRENLLVGLPDPGDDAIIAAMRRTGMDRIVAAHPKGLARPIAEGGKGLSGGQKQLLAFTRIALTAPEVLLLDEPTANLDDEQERQCLSVLGQEASRGCTMVIVTHKSSLLPLVNRIIVMVGNRIVLDGPRDAVLQRLKGETLNPAPNEKIAVQPA